MRGQQLYSSSALPPKLSAFEQAPRQGFGDISESFAQLTADRTKGTAETADKSR